MTEFPPSAQKIYGRVFFSLFAFVVYFVFSTTMVLISGETSMLALVPLALAVLVLPGRRAGLPSDVQDKELLEKLQKVLGACTWIRGVYFLICLVMLALPEVLPAPELAP